MKYYALNFIYLKKKNKIKKERKKIIFVQENCIQIVIAFKFVKFSWFFKNFNLKK